MAAPTARVLRDGEPCQIPAREVVPGDILLIEEGDTLPADARVIESIVLRVAEAALTGESSPASKNPEVISAEAGIGDQENMVFSGTSVTTGRGSAVVVATGANSEIGRIAGSLQTHSGSPHAAAEGARSGRLFPRAAGHHAGRDHGRDADCGSTGANTRSGISWRS
jgi:Ca2+-transporting ATPase